MDVQNHDFQAYMWMYQILLLGSDLNFIILIIEASSLPQAKVNRLLMADILI